MWVHGGWFASRVERRFHSPSQKKALTQKNMLASFEGGRRRVHDMMHCIRATPKRGKYWEIHPRRPRDFPSFGGARTFSHHQSFYRDQKIVPCGHDSVKINPSLLMMREWSTLIMYDHQHFIATIIVSYDQWSNWSLPTSGIRRNIILCQPAVKWFDLVLTVDSWKWFIGPRLVFQPSTTSRDALLCFKESREPELHSQPKHIGPALDHLRKWIMTMIMFLDFEYILTN